MHEKVTPLLWEDYVFHSIRIPNLLISLTHVLGHLVVTWQYVVVVYLALMPKGLASCHD